MSSACRRLLTVLASAAVWLVQDVLQSSRTLTIGRDNVLPDGHGT